MNVENEVQQYRAITRAISRSLTHCELTFLARQPIDSAKAVEQHDAYCNALRRAGLVVERLPSNEDLPDSVFVEDTAVIFDEVAVLTRPAVPSRRLEVEEITTYLAAYRPIQQIVEPGTLDGGDVLTVGKTVFVGDSSRTNREGQLQLTAIAHSFGYRVTPNSSAGSLPLKTGVTALDQETLLINSRWIKDCTFPGFRRVEVPANEPFAANALTINGVTYLSSSWPQTRQLLVDLGMQVHVLEMSEFEKGEAGVTCLSLILRA